MKGSKKLVRDVVYFASSATSDLLDMPVAVEQKSMVPERAWWEKSLKQAEEDMALLDKTLDKITAAAVAMREEADARVAEMRSQREAIEEVLKRCKAHRPG